MIASTSSIEGTSVSGDIRSKKLSITNEGLGHIANILQDTLYTDKILAPIREYSTNAMDAHIEAGRPTEPILVKLPNRFSPVFAVRDYGIGMDDHRIWEVFCNYGSSTKRNTNEQVGMLGIGSKSAFAYPECKSFTVVSIRNGVKKSFVCHKGGCSEGELVQLSEETTNENDGLEIQIPVSVSDIQSFIDRSAKFFAHWEVTPKFEGATLEISKSEKLFEGVGWYMTKEDPNGYSNKGCKLLMGNIAYSVGNISTMKPSENGISDNDQYVYRKLMESNLILKSPIGSVDIAANREGLQMTDKTIKTIWSILKKVRQEIGAELQKKFDVLPTMWEKRILRHSFSSYNSPLANFGSFLPPHISNMAMSVRVDDDCGFDVVTYSKGRRGKRQVRGGSTHYTYSIEANENTCVILNEDATLVGTAARNRVVALIERTDNVFKKMFNTVYVFNIKDSAKFVTWKAKNLFDFPAVNLNTLPSFKFSEIYPHLRKPSTRSINADKNSKKFLLFDLNCASISAAEYFKAGVVPKKPVNRIPYIVIDRYEIVTKSGSIYPSDAISYLKGLEKDFKIKLPDTIVAVKKGSVERLEGNKDYISLWELLANQLKNNKEFFNRLVTLELRTQFPSLVGNGNRHLTTENGSIDGRIFSNHARNVSDFDADGLFHKILVSVQSMTKLVKLESGATLTQTNSVICSIRKSSKTLEDSVTSSVEKSAKDFKELLNGFYKMYPIVKHIDSYAFGYSNSSPIMTELGDYIKLVDASTK